MIPVDSSKAIVNTRLINESAKEMDSKKAIRQALISLDTVDIKIV
jgi:hypothetical protein